MAVDRRRVRIRDGVPWCVTLFVGVRVLLSVISVVGVHDATPASGVAGAIGTGAEVPATPGWHNAIDGTDRWDAAWFIEIADRGYDDDDASAAFFPGYPLVIRIADLLLPV